MRLASAVVAILRRLRAERGVVAFLFVLVTVTSFLVAVSPRLLDRVADDGLRDGLARATAIQRNIEFATVGRISTGPNGPAFSSIRHQLPSASFR